MLTGSEIAIIGLAGRFPGASGPEELWRNVRDGVESISFFSDRELAVAGVDSAVFRDPKFVRAGMLLDKADHFDAGFFGFSPGEAEVLDPQQRLFLECAWEALEDAGYDDESKRPVTGVYAGSGLPTYLLRNTQPFAPELLSTAANFQVMLSNDKDFLATRVSYKLNLKGPSLNVQTACSSSLVAVHLACQSLLSGECDMALAGGVSVFFPQQTGYLFQEGMIGSPDGHCRAFDAEAQGTIKGNGLGIVVLKPLGRALEDGDRIHAVIRGSAINNDGGAKVGYTAPGIDGQAAVVAEAQAVAGVEAADISYLETHGTGTPLGDPMEIEALARVFRASTDARGLCAIGSLKTNIGHLDTAAGIAGLIKTVLALRHRQIPPSLHYKAANPRIDFASSPFFVNTKLREWRAVRGSRLAGVSSFGIGGTNAHVVLEEAPEQRVSSTEGVRLLALSAKSPEALRAHVETWSRFLSSANAPAWSDICYTAASRRTSHDYRIAIAAPTREAAAGKLRTLNLDSVSRATSYSEPVFVFSGQGPQWDGMGRQLWETEPVFRDALELCDREIRRVAGWSVLEAFAAEETEFAQPAIFALQIALARLWESWGIRPAAVIGHSVGEIAAAHVAGALSLRDAVRLVCLRGRIMQKATGLGRMLAIELPASEAAKYGLEIAAINSPVSTVVAGAESEIERVAAQLEVQGVLCRILPGRYAFHCAQMAPFADELRASLGGLSPSAAGIRMYSAITGKQIRGEELTSSYWVRNVRETVQFAAAISEATVAGARTFLEISPAPVLGPMVSRCLAAAKVERTVLRSLARGQNEPETMLSSLGSLHAMGAPVQWSRTGNVVSLPPYPWQHKRYWREVSEQLGHPLLGARVDSPLAHLQFEAKIGAVRPAFLGDHRVMGCPVFPAAGYVEMALAAADCPCTIENLAIHRMLELPEGELRKVQFVQDKKSFKIFSLCDGKWELNASGEIGFELSGGTPLSSDPPPAAAVDLAEFYRRFSSRGVEFGPAFRLIEEIRTGANTAEGTAQQNEANPYHFHPALLDACFQISLAALPESGGGDVFLPVGIDRLQFFKSPGIRVRVRGSIRPDSLVADIEVFDEDGSAVANIEGFRLRRTRSVAAPVPLYEVSWRGSPLPPGPATAPGLWFLVPDSTGVASALASRLNCVEDLINATGVIYCAGLDCNAPEKSTEAVAALLPFLADKKLWIVIRSSELAQSAFRGISRVIGIEHPEVQGGLIELDSSSDPVEAILQQIEANRSGDREDHAAFRQNMRHVPRLIPVAATAGTYQWRNDAPYLITGGLTGLGLATARHIIERGGRHLVLIGRRPAAEVPEGVDIRAMTADVTSEAELTRVLETIRTTMPPLAGIIHAAGTLDDGVLAGQTPARFARVMDPKIRGAWNLHRLTRDIPLDLFALYSSAVSLTGTAAQGNYAAANQFLDALAHCRRAEGLPALSINWGPWETIGMSAGQGERGRARREALGLRTIAPQQGLELLDRLIASGHTQVCAFPVDWVRFAAQYPGGRVPPFLSELVTSLASTLTAVPRNQRELKTHVRGQVAGVLGTQAASIRSGQGFTEMGLDSLMAVELSNRLQSSLYLMLPSTLTFDYPTIDQLTEFRALHVLDTAPEPEQAADKTTVFDGLSGDDLMALFDKEMATVEELMEGAANGRSH